jgi:hypothetical protein
LVFIFRADRRRHGLGQFAEGDFRIKSGIAISYTLRRDRPVPFRRLNLQDEHAA